MKGYSFLETLIRKKILKTKYLRTFDIFINKQFDGKKGIVGAEIGVLKGNHANSLLHHCKNIDKLFLIDSYTNYEGYNYFAKPKDIGLSNYKKMAINNLAEYKNKIVFVEKMFQDAIGDVPDDLDFVYYDIRDDVERITSFLELYYPKVHVGGVIGGGNWNAKYDGVARAVTAFNDRVGLELCGRKNDWWFVKKIKDK